jgi:hypothetical protein
MRDLTVPFSSTKYWPLILCAITSLLAPPAYTQQRSEPDKPPFAVGVYDALGLQFEQIPSDQSGKGVFTLGLYGELPRVLLRPGLDLRCLCGDNGVQGMLTGPRISARVAEFRPYAEALFGPNHAISLDPSNPSAIEDRHGITSVGVLGVDFARKGFFNWRIIEVSFGSFSGIPDSRPITVSTGIVFRIPKQ